MSYIFLYEDWFSSDFTYLSITLSVHSTMNQRIEKLEQSLQTDHWVCIAATHLHTFPKQFFEPFQSADIGFIVCRKGGFQFTIQGKTYQAHTDETVFLPADSPFQIVSHTDQLECYLMLYNVAHIRDSLGITVTSMHIYYKIYPHNHLVYHTGKEEDLIRYIALIDSTLHTPESPFNIYEQKLLLISLTYQLCSIFQRKIEVTHPSNARRTDVFLRLIQSIDAHYKHERGVEFYANQLCLTPKYLSSLSKSICGYTVQELVFLAIIRDSKTMLNTSNLTVQEIANEFHFPNASSFGTFFKKQTGHSPQKYRELEEGRKNMTQEI